MSVCGCSYIRTYIRMSLCGCLYLRMYVCLCGCLYLRMYVRMPVCVWLFVCTYVGVYFSYVRIYVNFNHHLVQESEVTLDFAAQVILADDETIDMTGRAKRN